MAKMVVLKYPNPILRQEALPITEFNDDLKTLADDMFETMHAHQGVGLAGPQVGILQQIFVAQFKRKKMVLINPKITFASEKMDILEEGCLSIPNRTVMVKRPKSIQIEAQDITGKPVVYKEKGFMARILQHEFDHLKGVLIIDKELPQYELEGEH